MGFLALVDNFKYYLQIKFVAKSQFHGLREILDFKIREIYFLGCNLIMGQVRQCVLPNNIKKEKKQQVTKQIFVGTLNAKLTFWRKKFSSKVIALRQ